jgi:hypothetical protein
MDDETSELTFALPLPEVLQTLRFAAEQADVFDKQAGDVTEQLSGELLKHGFADSIALLGHFVRVIGHTADDALPPALRFYSSMDMWLYGRRWDDPPLTTAMAQGFDEAAQSVEPDTLFPALKQIALKASMIDQQATDIIRRARPHVDFDTLGAVTALAGLIKQLGAMVERALPERERWRDAEEWAMPAG